MKRRRGLTLIELLLVTALLTFLGAIAFMLVEASYSVYAQAVAEYKIQSEFLNIMWQTQMKLKQACEITSASGDTLNYTEVDLTSISPGGLPSVVPDITQINALVRGRSLYFSSGATPDDSTFSYFPDGDSPSGSTQQVLSRGGLRRVSFSRPSNSTPSYNNANDVIVSVETETVPRPGLQATGFAATVRAAGRCSRAGD